MSGEFSTSENRFYAGPVKSAHSQWKKRMADLLSGKISLDPSQVVDHRSCEFGKWYFSHGTELYGHLPLFEQIDSRHSCISCIRLDGAA